MSWHHARTWSRSRTTMGLAMRIVLTGLSRSVFKIMALKAARQIANAVGLSTARPISERKEAALVTAIQCTLMLSSTLWPTVVIGPPSTPLWQEEISMLLSRHSGHAPALMLLTSAKLLWRTLENMFLNVHSFAGHHSAIVFDEAMTSAGLNNIPATSIVAQVTYTLHTGLLQTAIVEGTFNVLQSLNANPQPDQGPVCPWPIWKIDLPATDDEDDGGTDDNLPSLKMRRSMSKDLEK